MQKLKIANPFNFSVLSDGKKKCCKNGSFLTKKRQKPIFLNFKILGGKF